ncbi:MAG: sulfatase-like hydrolase/transferase [Bacteroidetes bacterium]|nr:sulfatase-like hydrolase/transferase [Bacteroidota bacterium]
MTNALKKIPAYTFLLCPTLIFFLYVHNYPNIFLENTLRSLLLSTSISFLFFTATYFIFKKNQHKAGFITLLIMVPVFSYGLIYELLESLFYKGLWPFSNIHRYLLLFLILIYTFLYFWVSRAKRSYRSITLPLNFFVLFIMFINGANLSYRIITKPVSVIKDQDFVSIKNNINDTFPDIYYIILDGYANDQTLKKFYNYPHNSLTLFLKQNGFYVATESRANYLVTSESLGSSLNHMYIDSVSKENPTKSSLIYKNEVSRYLKEHGYKIVHINSGYSVTRQNYYADETIYLKSLSEFERTLLRYTIFRLDDLLGYTQYNILKEQLSTIYELIKIKGPKFVFIHIVSPHPPYVCDADGNFKKSPPLINDWWEPKNDYVQQSKFVNRNIQNFITEVLLSSKIKPIILVQSDHGPWMKSHSLTGVYNARSLILNSYLVPDSWRNKLYNTITPVNSFPFIFNNLFKDSIPLLKDIPMDSIGMKRYRQTQEMIND